MTLRKFMLAYKEASLKGVESFIFDGKEFVTRYAYYLIQYLTDVKKMTPDCQIDFQTKE